MSKSFYSKISLSALADFLLISSLFVHILISTISNYRVTTLVLKFISFLLLIFIYYFNCKLNKTSITEIFYQKNFLIIIKFLIVSLLIFSFSLTYSANFYFGILKLFCFLIGVIPSIIVAYFISTYWDETKEKILLNLSFFSALIISLFILILNPIDFDKLGTINLTTWSYVFVGRYLTLTFISSLILFSLRERNFSIFYAIGIAIIIQAIFLTGMRAALIGLFAITIYYTVVNVISFRYSIKTYLPILILLLIIFLSQTIFHNRTEIYNRYETITEGNFDQDWSIPVRIEAIKIGISNFLDNPILGIGFGGYNNVENGFIAVDIKYPHNIVVEFAAELGLIGIGIFIYFLFISGKTVRNLSWEVKSYFIASLIFAFTSKDIASQAILWIVIGINSNAILKSKEETNI